MSYMPNYERFWSYAFAAVLVSAIVGLFYYGYWWRTQASCADIVNSGTSWKDLPARCVPGVPR